MVRKERGMSLVELLVAMMILMLGVVPMLRGFMFGLRTGNRANKLSTATNLARDMAEEIRFKAFSEEFTEDFAGDPEDFYPMTTTIQSFGLEESFEAGDTRLERFDDVDDYDGWCRGSGCADSSKPLESAGGHPYTGGRYPSYYGFTRRVKVFNIFPIPEFRSYKDPYPDDNSAEPMAIDRFNLEAANLPNLTSDADGGSATGRTPVKVVEIVVSYRGPGIEDVDVKDVNFVVMPLRRPAN